MVINNSAAFNRNYEWMLLYTRLFLPLQQWKREKLLQDLHIVRDTDRIHSNKFRYRCGVLRWPALWTDEWRKEGTEGKNTGEHSNVYMMQSGTSAGKQRPSRSWRASLSVPFCPAVVPYLPKHWLKPRICMGVC